MKKVLALVLAVLGLCLVFSGCGNSKENNDIEKTYYTVIFRQVGQDDVKITVESGKGVLEDQIPTPKPKEGYAIAWENVDLSCITKDIVVNAIEVYSGLKITLVYPEIFPESLITVSEITVAKGMSFNLPKMVAGPVGEAWGITAWVTEDGVEFPFSGVYNLDDSISLTAVVEQWI